jgi:hypothetical protein
MITLPEMKFQLVDNFGPELPKHIESHIPGDTEARWSCSLQVAGSSAGPAERQPKHESMKIAGDIVREHCTVSLGVASGPLAKAGIVILRLC